MTDALAAIKQQRNKTKIKEAFQNFITDPAAHENAFWNAVLEFAKLKLYHLEVEFSTLGTAGTVDDYAQEVAIDVLTGLPSFSGNADSFYPWLHRICFTRACRFFKELKNTKNTKAGVTITVEDDEGSEEIENPALYAGEPKAFVIDMPDDIQGIERDICDYIMAGDDYAKIARQMGMTVGAVEARIRRMRNKHGKKGTKRARVA